MTKSQILNVANTSYEANRENKILVKISKFSVLSTACDMWTYNKTARSLQNESILQKAA